MHLIMLSTKCCPFCPTANDVIIDHEADWQLQISTITGYTLVPVITGMVPSPVQASGWRDSQQWLKPNTSNTINFLQITHGKHCIVQLWGRGMGCLLQVYSRLWIICVIAISLYNICYNGPWRGQYHACRCSGDFRSQCISRHGIDPKSRNIPSLASED